VLEHLRSVGARAANGSASRIVALSSSPITMLFPDNDAMGQRLARVLKRTDADLSATETLKLEAARHALAVQAHRADTDRSTAHPVAQVKYPATLNHHVRILQ